MLPKIGTQRTLSVFNVDDYLLTWLEAFLIDRKAGGVANGTLRFYRQKIKLFSDYCDALTVKQIGQITPSFLRQYLLYLEESGHNPDGRHAAFRLLRAFFLWYEDEVEPQEWSNPIRKVKAPRVPVEPLEPISFETVAQMVKACPHNTFTGDRDAAILLCLLDTGARASEFLSINANDINQARGDILIRQGKGRKPRTVYIGKQSKRALRRYLNHRRDECAALWVTQPRCGSERLGYDGLRGILTRRAEEIGGDKPSPHDFRRAFALSMLRNGTDIFTLAKLMGHEGINVLQRYLKQTNLDTEKAHQRAGDPACFIPHMQQQHWPKGRKPKRGSGDAAYSSEENYAYLEKNQMENYLKHHTFYQETHPPRNPERVQKAIFRSENFPSDPERDTFTCPAYRPLTYRETRSYRRENGYRSDRRYYECHDCSACPLKPQCTKAKGNRRIQVSFKLREYRRQAGENLLSEQGIALRQPRCIEPESTFGDVKHNLGFRRFHLRGLEKFETEWALVCSVHHLRKLAAI
jgi:site-specific recombinase XerD